jgi:hypothetical protein
MTQNESPFQRKFATLDARTVFECPVWLLFAPKAALSQNQIFFPTKVGNTLP